MKHPYSIDPWAIVEAGFSPEKLRESESVFALANGFIGMRGNLEEREAAGANTIEGTFLNGVFDSEPITYGEAAYGYAKNHETICNVMDAKSLLLVADEEALDLGLCVVMAHSRTLDMRAGTLRRRFLWHTLSGSSLDVEIERLVSLTHQELAAVRLRVRCLSGACAVSVVSDLSPAVIAAGDPNDPRNAAGKDRRLLTVSCGAQGPVLTMQQHTKNTGFTINCAVEHRCSLPFSTRCGADAVTWVATRELEAGDELLLEKSICYTVSRAGEADALPQAVDGCRAAPDFDTLAAEQRAYLDAFWEGAGMEIDGDDALLQGLRFNLFHLIQSAGRDGKRNIAAKGLTGEGYEGHTFWDTEAYILPVFLYTEPQLARRLLEYRYASLPKARARARVMGHPRGALFPWRTIDGEECSAYFPAGSAQYHIDGDIALAVRDYFLVTEDLDFLAAYGAEILVETARLFYDLGFFSEAKGGRFVLNCVTGPDEYNVMVDNNVYTNAVAEENFRSAAAVMALIKNRRPEDYVRLCAALDYAPSEADDWLVAAERMYYPPARDGIYPQDDGFLERKPWPLDSIPAEMRPLLMHYHGLTIYRHRICKQADLILAMTLFGERYSLEEKKKNFAFYDSVTTHDSSLSMAVFSILANEIGETDTAYRYFMSCARLDLDDMHHNTKDGLHMANMAGAWNCMTKGFGGMRCRDGTLCFAPVCPPQWKGYAFRVRFRGRTIEVRVGAEGASYRLLSGEPIAIIADGQTLTLS
ncbi:MAG: glycoside hydrolase family 65 protein [Oscillospiraceae bacterium]|nr:glycoside hydrolase family 65 protein [Oscillospiraceae bacterium]